MDVANAHKTIKFIYKHFGPREISTFENNDGEGVRFDLDGAKEDYTIASFKSCPCFRMEVASCVGFSTVETIYLYTKVY